MSQLSSALRGSVEEGVHRLERSTSSLLATGAVGGVDISIGLFALLLVQAHSGNELLAAFAFGIGFMALAMAGSELFTENFLLPLMAVATHKARWRQVWRLWGGTALMNLVGGGLMVVIFSVAFPDLGGAAVRAGHHFIDRGIGVAPFCGSIVAGVIITLMTWMQSGTPTLGPRLAAAFGAAFLLAYGELGHVIVASLEIFAAIAYGADFGLLDWLPLFVQMALGNAVGGIGLVTLLRLAQVGRKRLQNEQARQVPPDEPDEEPSPVILPNGQPAPAARSTLARGAAR